MFHIPLTRRMTATYAAAVLVASLVASLINVGTAAAQGGTVTVTVHNAGNLPISIHIQGLKDYREDLDGGQTKSVPAGNLSGITPNNNIQWEARPRDLQNVSQPRTLVCARGVVIFQGQAGHVDVTKCDQTPTAVSVNLQQAYGKQWGDFCLAKDSKSCCTASERFSGTPDCKTKDTCKVSVHICETMVACNAALNTCKKKTMDDPKKPDPKCDGAACKQCTADYKKCHDAAVALSN